MDESFIYLCILGPDQRAGTPDLMMRLENAIVFIGKRKFCQAEAAQK
jgi:hypothetical protein